MSNTRSRKWWGVLAVCAAVSVLEACGGGPVISALEAGTDPVRSSRIDRKEAVRKIDEILSCQGLPCAVPTDVPYETRLVKSNFELLSRASLVPDDLVLLVDETITAISRSDEAQNAFRSCELATSDDPATGCSAEFAAYLEQLQALRSRFLEWQAKE